MATQNQGWISARETWRCPKGAERKLKCKRNDSLCGGTVKWQEVPNPELTQENEINNTDGKRKQIGGDHYAKHTIQPWDIIREYELDYFEGSCLKYLLRRKNNRLEDLQKAAHYIEECIKNEQKRMDNV